MAKAWRKLLAVGVLAASANGVAAPAPEPWDLWDARVPENTARIDHSAWQGFLDLYLVAQPDGVNRVAYRRVTKDDRGRLQDYLDALSGIDPREYSSAEQMAYWINLYNALTVEVVLRYPKKRSILRMGEKLFSIGPWDDKLITVAGEEITLNDIEHRILRPVFRDHRIHYAVNCASISCPNLVAEAYTRENTERLLSENERDYINHERGLRFDQRGRLVLSQIYKWYLEDFGSDTQALVTYLSRHHATASDRLAGFSGRIKYDYDWALNGAPD